MDGQHPNSIVAAGIFFLVVFGGLTIAAISTAELNFATIVIAAISLFVCVAVAGALIAALRKPPDE